MIGEETNERTKRTIIFTNCHSNETGKCWDKNTVAEYLFIKNASFLMQKVNIIEMEIYLVKVSRIPMIHDILYGF